MLLNPKVHLESPTQASEQYEQAAIAAAERRKDEEELAKHSSRFKYKKGREMMQRMGWVMGMKLGRQEQPVHGTELRAVEVDNYATGRAQHAGLGTKRFGEGQTYRFQSMLDELLALCRQTQTTPLD